MDNNCLVSFGIVKLCELINQKNIDLSTTIDVLNDALKQLNVSDTNYESKMKAITDAILELKQNHDSFDKETFLKKMFYIQQLFDLSSLYKAST